MFAFVTRLSCRRFWLSSFATEKRNDHVLKPLLFLSFVCQLIFWWICPCYLSQEADASVSCPHFTAQLSGGLIDHTQLMFSIPKAPNQCFHNLFTRCLNNVWCCDSVKCSFSCGCRGSTAYVCFISELRLIFGSVSCSKYV